MLHGSLGVTSKMPTISSATTWLRGRSLLRGGGWCNISIRTTASPTCISPALPCLPARSTNPCPLHTPRRVIPRGYSPGNLLTPPGNHLSSLVPSRCKELYLAPCSPHEERQGADLRLLALVRLPAAPPLPYLYPSFPTRRCSGLCCCILCSYSNTAASTLVPLSPLTLHLVAEGSYLLPVVPVYPLATPL